VTPQETAGTALRFGLSEDDVQAVTRSSLDISDIPAASLARFKAGFQDAYHVAELVSDGRKNPLSR
jgi:hypothetical protein